MADKLTAEQEEQRKQLFETFGLDDDGNPPELHPDLIPHLYTDGDITHLKHPWVFSIMHSPVQNGIANKSYEYKKKAVAEAEANGDWGTYVWLHERPYRISAFYGIRDNLTDDHYWKLLSDLWTDTENMWQNGFTWSLCLEDTRPGRYENFMDDDERAVLEGLDDRFQIFRGSSENTPPGMAWTLNRERGEWFARRYVRDDHLPVLLTAWVERKKVIAYLDGRKEEEIVVLPADIEDVERKVLISIDDGAQGMKA